jgi:hypothetical protein
MSTPQEPVNDIPIQDKEVSRAHAKSFIGTTVFYSRLKISHRPRINGTKRLPPGNNASKWYEVMVARIIGICFVLALLTKSGRPL